MAKRKAKTKGSSSEKKAIGRITTSYCEAATIGSISAKEAEKNGDKVHCEVRLVRPSMEPLVCSVEKLLQVWETLIAAVNGDATFGFVPVSRATTDLLRLLREDWGHRTREHKHMSVAGCTPEEDAARNAIFAAATGIDDWLKLACVANDAGKRIAPPSELIEILRGATTLLARKTPPEPDTPLQKNILKALDGKGLKKEQLAQVVCGSDGSRLYKPGGIKELMAQKRVMNKKCVGYYRPDMPPQ